MRSRAKRAFLFAYVCKRVLHFSDVAWTSPLSPHGSNVRFHRVAWTLPLSRFCRGIAPWIQMAARCRDMGFLIMPATMLANPRNRPRRKRHLLPLTTVTLDYNERGAEKAEKSW